MARFEQRVIPIQDLSLVAAAVPASDVDLPTGTRGLLIGIGGLLNVTINGNDYDGVPFLAGVTPGAWERVRTGGDASNVWAVL